MRNAMATTGGVFGPGQAPCSEARTTPKGDPGSLNRDNPGALPGRLDQHSREGTQTVHPKTVVVRWLTPEYSRRPSSATR